MDNTDTMAKTRVAVRDNSLRETRFGPSPSALGQRVKRLQQALVDEDWLPIGLRALLASELPWIRRRLASGVRAGRAQAAQRVHELALMSFRYGSETLDSEAVAQLRALDLALNPFHVTSEILEAWEHGEPRSSPSDWNASA